MAGARGGAGTNRVDAELLGELVQLLAIRGLLGDDLVQRSRRFSSFGAERHSICRYPIATIRSIGIRARSAISSGTLTSNFISRSASRSFGRVIIFMYLQ